MDAKGAAEAALFASPENLRISDIAERTGFPEEEIRTALMDLRREYEERDSAIVIAKIGSEYGMMLRAEYSDFPGMFGKAEMSGGLMRTLSTIAYNQPVLQSELVRTRGPRGYDDVHRLIEMGFVSGKKSGQTLELTTTKKFSDYFGIGSTRKADIRKWIESQASNSRMPEDGQERRLVRKHPSHTILISNRMPRGIRLHTYCIKTILYRYLSNLDYISLKKILIWVHEGGKDIMTVPPADVDAAPSASAVHRDPEDCRCPF